MPLELRRPRLVRRQRHRVGERIAERGDLDAIADCRVPETFGVGPESKPMRDPFAHGSRNVAHTHDVAVPPLIDRIDIRPQPALEARRILPSRIATHFAQIVTLSREARRHTVAEQT